jgi:hypothetical protein
MSWRCPGLAPPARDRAWRRAAPPATDRRWRMVCHQWRRAGADRAGRHLAPARASWRGRPGNMSRNPGRWTSCACLPMAAGWPRAPHSNCTSAAAARRPNGQPGRSCLGRSPDHPDRRRYHALGWRWPVMDGGAVRRHADAATLVRPDPSATPRAICRYNCRARCRCAPSAARCRGADHGPRRRRAPMPMW